jgi:hypothetical protein
MSKTTALEVDGARLAAAVVAVVRALFSRSVLNEQRVAVACMRWNLRNVQMHRMLRKEAFSRTLWEEIRQASLH